jgi:signal recognition particle subunit SRP54
VLNFSRKKRSPRAAELKVEDVNKLLKQFDMMQKLAKQFSGAKLHTGEKGHGRFGGMGYRFREGIRDCAAGTPA